MLINVNVEVPDGDFCDIRGNKCKHYRYSSGPQKWKCAIFNQQLKRDENYDLVKCRKCLNATREESL